jgi:hypothetical protein
MLVIKIPSASSEAMTVMDPISEPRVGVVRLIPWFPSPFRDCIRNDAGQCCYS